MSAAQGEPVRHALHGSVELEIDLAAPPARVFSAFSDPELRRHWFQIPSEPGTARHEMDFRVGGREVSSGTLAPAGVPEHVELRSQFLDIATDRRIVTVSEMTVDGRRRSLSLVTVEFAPNADGTHLTYTDQFVFVSVAGDGAAELGERRGGTRLLLNRLASVVER